MSEEKKSYKEQLEQAKKAGTTKKVDVRLYKFDKPGDFVLGRYVRKEEIESTSKLSDNPNAPKTYQQYFFHTDDGMIKFSLGSVADVDIGGQMKENEVYYIAYEGKQELSGGHQMNLYSCLHVQ